MDGVPRANIESALQKVHVSLFLVTLPGFSVAMVDRDAAAFN